ncbi:DUF1524 domain-containing protein (plasmid) [Microvirga sp. VF16]|nr:DUF1524 domain-containing protein [Microvirga sp. VF16]
MSGCGDGGEGTSGCCGSDITHNLPFGNLTVLSHQLNSAVSNSGWGMKKPELMMHSLLLRYRSSIRSGRGQYWVCARQVPNPSTSLVTLIPSSLCASLTTSRLIS